MAYTPQQWADLWAKGNNHRHQIEKRLQAKTLNSFVSGPVGLDAGDAEVATRQLAQGDRDPMDARIRQELTAWIQELQDARTNGL